MAVGQYLYGNPRPVMAAFTAGNATVAYAVGDLVLMSGSTITPMGTSTTVTNFLGVCAQRRDGTSGSPPSPRRLLGNNEEGSIRVDTDGVWLFPRSDTPALKVGDVMTTDGITANTLALAGAESVSIARVVEPAAASSATCKVKIQSRVIPAGPIS